MSLTHNLEEIRCYFCGRLLFKSTKALQPGVSSLKKIEIKCTNRDCKRMNEFSIELTEETPKN